MMFAVIVSLLCLLSSSVWDVAAISLDARRESVPAGFVTTKGSQFELDGKPFVREYRGHFV